MLPKEMMTLSEVRTLTSTRPSSTVSKTHMSIMRLGTRLPGSRHWQLQAPA